MTIAPALLREYPAMNKAQRAVVTHDQGPLLVIAGPGSGKTSRVSSKYLSYICGVQSPSVPLPSYLDESRSSRMSPGISVSARGFFY